MINRKVFARVGLLLLGVANAQNAHFVCTPKASLREGFLCLTIERKQGESRFAEKQS
jgi:hypothetical protein